MHGLFSGRALGALAVAFALVTPGIARAQDDPPAPAPAPAHHHRCPTCGAELPAERCPICGSVVPDPVDRKLDEVLRREYGDPNGPAPPPRDDEPVPPPVRRAPPPPAHHEGESDFWEDDFFRIRLGMSFDAGLAAVLEGKIRGRNQPDWSVPGDHHRDPHGGAFSMHGSTWVDLGRFFTIEMQSAADIGRLSHRHDDNNNQFGWNGGDSWDHHHRQVELGTADLDLILHPVNNRWGRLDLIVGGRYLEAREGTSSRHMHSVEAGMPMIGIGGVLRPVRTEKGGFALEIFARGEVGALAYGDYERRDDRWRDDNWDRPRSKYFASSADAWGGVRFVFEDTFGVALGARFDYADVDKRDDWNSTDKKVNWKSVGPFIQFSMEM